MWSSPRARRRQHRPRVSTANRFATCCYIEAGTMSGEIARLSTFSASRARGRFIGGPTKFVFRIDLDPVAQLVEQRTFNGNRTFPPRSARVLGSLRKDERSLVAVPARRPLSPRGPLQLPTRL